MQKRVGTPVVEVPDRVADRPVWARVGVIAVVGFAIGIAWPRFAGVQLGPAPPDDGPRASDSDGVASSVDSSVPSGVVSQTAVGSPRAPAPVLSQTVAVKRTDVLSCRDLANKVVDTCDRPDFDTLFMPMIKELDKCPSAAGLAGKLSIGFDVDFESGKVRPIQGKSTTIPRTTVEGIWNCVIDGIKRIRVSGLRHDQRRYTVFYSGFFFPPGKIVDPDMQSDEPIRDLRPDVAMSDDRPDEAPGSSKESGDSLGTAQVVYDTVLVRDEPKTGKVVARLVRGTRVEILSKNDSWYRIKFEQREGWVYRGALAQ